MGGGYEDDEWGESDVAVVSECYGLDDDMMDLWEGARECYAIDGTVGRESADSQTRPLRHASNIIVDKITIRIRSAVFAF